MQYIYTTGFVQAVLVMAVYERRLSFRVLHFVKNDHKLCCDEGDGLGAL